MNTTQFLIRKIQIKLFIEIVIKSNRVLQKKNPWSLGLELDPLDMLPALTFLAVVGQTEKETHTGVCLYLRLPLGVSVNQISQQLFYCLFLWSKLNFSLFPFQKSTWSSCDSFLCLTETGAVVSVSIKTRLNFVETVWSMMHSVCWFLAVLLAVDTSVLCCAGPLHAQCKVEWYVWFISFVHTLIDTFCYVWFS